MKMEASSDKFKASIPLTLTFIFSSVQCPSYPSSRFSRSCNNDVEYSQVKFDTFLGICRHGMISVQAIEKSAHMLFTCSSVSDDNLSYSSFEEALNTFLFSHFDVFNTVKEQ